MVEIQGVEGVYERLFLASGTKDVEIVMSDGSLWAHSIILSANSEAIDGMLKHGSASKEKKLHWDEHPMSVGRFVLRLMYTGTVDSSDWEKMDKDAESSNCSNNKGEEIPLELVLAGLAITKTYMIPHLLASFAKALEARLSTDTFNDICKCAVKYDVTSLRLSCLAAARGQNSKDPATLVTVTGCGVPEFNGEYVPDGEKNGKTRYKINNGSNKTINLWRTSWYLSEDYAGSCYEKQAEDSSSCVPPRGLWTVAKKGVPPAPTISTSAAATVNTLYIENKLAPEVMSELASLFGTPEPQKKRRRTL
eukprot:TRINITY_DN77613_c0_g1_i1.p1 TRINITY_DN77613_c0_g1~~TRINITY_DN77613_c0_g1_i1.p1  ORF type:complete len:307 (+),score=47.15 TRINITY_DN77613_c0_g1_i1:62-982(+)